MKTSCFLSTPSPRYLNDSAMIGIVGGEFTGMPFGLCGCIDAPRNIPAGSHYRYESRSYGYGGPSAFDMPTSIDREG